MQLRSHSYSDVNMAPNDPDPVAPPTQVTLINDSVNLPHFSGNGSESVHSFVRRVSEECTRRNAQTDPEKLAILKSRVCHEPSSLAGKLVKTDKFLSFTEFHAFTKAFISHFAGHSKLGATHSLLKFAQTLTLISRSTTDVFKAENVASSLSAELTDQLKASAWVDDDHRIKAVDFKRLMSYFLFIVQLDSSTFNVASDIEFKKHDFLYDVCQKITEKAPPAAQPVSAVHTTHPHNTGYSHSQSHSPSRSRSHSRPSHNPHSRHRSKSRNSRNVTCHRCGLKGHFANYCRVILDDNGQRQYNPNAYCSFHNKPGHTLAECRAHQSQQATQPPSGNYSRPATPPPT